MCTVTFLPFQDTDFVLMSNRDETPLRKSLPPEEYKEQGHRVLCPKDTVAQGTWVGVGDTQRIGTIMNGAFERHKRNPTYRKSRGLVMKDFLLAKDITTLAEQYDYSGIEPFTLILVDWSAALKLYQLVWDGEKAHQLPLPLKPSIWSSAPLYDAQMKEQRNHWFYELPLDQPNATTSLRAFHREGGVGDPEIDITMNRGFVRTVSITEIRKQGNTVKMVYEDLLTGKIVEKEMVFGK